MKLLMHMHLKCHLGGALGILYSSFTDGFILLWDYTTYEIHVIVSVMKFVSPSQWDSDRYYYSYWGPKIYLHK